MSGRDQALSRGPKEKKKTISYAKWGYIFLIPFFIAYVVFTLYPQLLTFGYSFFTYYRVGRKWVGPEFAGFQNYIELFTPGEGGTIMIFKTLLNTIILWLICAVPQFVVSLLLAVIFTSSRLKVKGQGFFKTVFYMPNVIMASAFGLLFMELFGKVGPIHQIFVSGGLIEESYNFLGQRVPVRFIIGMVNYLMWFGNTTLLLMAGIQSIDDSIFESARIDGSGAFHTFRTITMPLLKPIFIYVLITSMIGGLQMYDVPQIITNGNGTPNETSTTLIMYLKRILDANDYGRAGAFSVILFLFTAILGIFFFRNITKDNTD
ncbi:MAG: sugar ABC transporter permease [Bacilli bacterium]|nr:sugar ABC transporter permease [Bacilli bacterium]